MENNQPNWDALAEKFDLWLPHIAPAGEELLSAIQTKPGDRVLDIATGTGEPALTLAQNNPGIEVVAVDSAAGMVKAAQHKALRERIENIQFNIMQAEDLEFVDDCFDAVISRFGLMLFEDPAKGLNEMRRVLKPGGQLAVIVWGDEESFTTMQWAYQVLKDRLEEEMHPNLKQATSFGSPDFLTQSLQDAGFQSVEVTEKQMDYQFSSFDEYWQLIEASEIMKQQLEALETETLTLVRDEIATLAATYQTDSGLLIPHRYLLATAHK